MLPRVKINYLNGLLGTVPSNQDGLLGLLVLGAAAVSTTFELGKHYRLVRPGDLVPLGITSANNARIVELVNQFYAEAEEGTPVYLIGLESTSMTTVLDVTTGPMKDKLLELRGALRGLIVASASTATAVVTDGLDPDEFIRRDGAEGFRNLPAVSPAVYRLRRLKEQFDLSVQDGRLAYARGASEIVSAVDPLERDVLLGQLSLETGFSRETLTEQMNLSAQKAAVRTTEPSARPRTPVRTVSGEVGTDDMKAQELLISLFASGKIPKDMIEEKDFDDDELKSLYRELAAGASPASLPDLAPDDASRSRYTRLLLTPAAGSTDEMISMANDCLVRIPGSPGDLR